MAADDYRLGIDLGTTFTAAAVGRGGRVEPVPLGAGHGTAVPTVVHLAGDEMHVGVEAVRRSATDPGLVVREFKRRVGDPTPFVVGGRSVGADELMARVVSWVVEEVSASEGGPPQAVGVTHPANWGDHKRDLLRQAIGRQGVRLDRLVPEPVAAGHYYATQRRPVPGSVVAVYDLGGGTFDAAVVQVDGPVSTIRGRPDGIERLGGIDFDEAVFGYVLRAIDLDPDTLDPDDPAMVAAVARLRRSCVEAKEGLSDTSELTIPVMLPDRHTQVPLTRASFEAMIRPALDETVVALRRAVESAGVAVDDLTAVLLVGGSSRIPLVERLVGGALGRPVATDARPKDAISMGAALVAAQGELLSAAPAPPIAVGPVPAPPSPRTGDPAPRSRRRLVALLAGLALVAGAIVTGVVLAGDGSDETDTTAPTEETDDAGGAEPAGTGEGGAEAEAGAGADHRIAGAYDLSGVTAAVGWLDTTDQFLVANITAYALEEAGATVQADRPALAVGAEALRNQLVAGDIDLFWDYVGRPAGIEDDQLPLDASAAARQERLNELDAPNAVVWLEPAAFTLEQGLGVRREVAEELGISSIADVAGLIDEDPDSASVCYVIEDRLRGLEAAYGLRFATPVFVPDPGTVYSRLADGDCTFAEIPHAIHPAMSHLDLTLLDDNRSYYTPMNPAPRLRAELVRSHPEIRDLFAPIARSLDNATMAELVSRVEVDGELAADVALDWLRTEGFVAG
jgi:glycine betaine/choline ABC-type transport system substrate-binding protein/actin-like ATPase involved in cell morphogenesis